MEQSVKHFICIGKFRILFKTEIWSLPAEREVKAERGIDVVKGMDLEKGMDSEKGLRSGGRRRMGAIAELTAKRVGIMLLFMEIGMVMGVLVEPVYAQDGNAGIAKANEMLRGYYDTAVNLLYAIGAIVGVIGAVRVYRVWVEGEGHAAKAAAAWFSACIFLVLVATVIKSFFGI